MKNKIRIVMDYETDLNKELEAQKVKHVFIINLSNPGGCQNIYIGAVCVEHSIGRRRYEND